MVQGMRDVITNIVQDLARCQQDATRFWQDAVCFWQDATRFQQDAKRYYDELEELKSRMGGKVVVSRDLMAPVSPSKKRKLKTEESGPCETPAVFIEKHEHLPLRKSNNRPAIPVKLVQESVIKKNMDESDDLPLTRMKSSRLHDVHASASLICSEVKTEKVESVAVVVPVREPVDATMTSTSANCPTADSTTLTFSAPKDIIPPLVQSTSVSSQVEDEGFEYVGNFKIPKVYADLYRKIFSKYGHMATTKVIKSNEAILLAAVTSLLKIARAMETAVGADLSEALLESWEGDIKDAETLQFNVKWLREKLNRLKIYLKLSVRIDEELERREQVLDKEQAKYVDLISRKDKLETELVEVKNSIRKSEVKISSEREAIRTKTTEKNVFLSEPVLRNLFC